MNFPVAKLTAPTDPRVAYQQPPSLLMVETVLSFSWLTSRDRCPFAALRPPFDRRRPIPLIDRGRWLPVGYTLESTYCAAQRNLRFWPFKDKRTSPEERVARRNQVEQTSGYFLEDYD